MKLSKVRCLSGNAIKLFACLCMLLDHIGVLWKIDAIRYIGRLAMPLFAFFIAEGCKYTKDKTKHFALIFSLGVFCQIVYSFAEPNDFHLNILLTFSLSIIIIYAMQHLKKTFSTKSSPSQKSLAVIIFVGMIVVTVLLNLVKTVNHKPFHFDHGFWGCMLPVFASLLDFRAVNLPEKLKWLNNYYLSLIPFVAGLSLLCAFGGFDHTIWFTFLSIIPLALYNEKRGRFNIKYFFYIFYPLHLAILYGILLIF